MSAYTVIKSPQAAAEFLRFLWSSNHMKINEKEKMKEIEQKTRLAMQYIFLGSPMCEARSGDGDDCAGAIEGHHLKAGDMKVSEYRHCATRKF